MNFVFSRLCQNDFHPCPRCMPKNILIFNIGCVYMRKKMYIRYAIAENSIAWMSITSNVSSCTLVFPGYYFSLFRENDFCFWHPAELCWNVSFTSSQSTSFSFILGCVCTSTSFFLFLSFFIPLIWYIYIYIYSFFFSHSCTSTSFHPWDLA